MKQLLVLADLFPPAFAPRIAYLCKYLPQFGWQTHVITEQMPQSYVQNKTSHGNIYAGFDATGSVTRVDLSGNEAHSLRFLKELFFEDKERLFYPTARRIAEQVRPDAILALAYRKFPFATAQRLAEELKIPWIADCRDIIEQYPGNDFLPRDIKAVPFVKELLLSQLKRRFIYLRNRRIRHADRVVTVSPWHQEQLRKVNPHCELIYNGYDPELFYPQNKPSDKFIICFTGRLMSLEMRDPSLLIEALQAIALAPIRQQNLLELHFYVDEQSRSILSDLMQKAGLEALCRFMPMVPALELPAILGQASIILLLSNKETDRGPHGIVSTKLFEALAMEKPILMLRSDEAIGEQILRASAAGVAARRHEEVVDYIQQVYAQWQEQGFTQAQGVKADFLAQFSRIDQAKHYAALLDEICQ